MYIGINNCGEVRFNIDRDPSGEFVTFRTNLDLGRPYHYRYRGEASERCHLGTINPQVAECLEEILDPDCRWAYSANVARDDQLVVYDRRSHGEGPNLWAPTDEQLLSIAFHLKGEDPKPTVVFIDGQNADNQIHDIQTHLVLEAAKGCVTAAQECVLEAEDRARRQVHTAHEAGFHHGMRVGSAPFGGELFGIDEVEFGDLPPEVQSVLRMIGLVPEEPSNGHGPRVTAFGIGGPLG